MIKLCDFSRFARMLASTTSLLLLRCYCVCVVAVAIRSQTEDQSQGTSIANLLARALC